MEETPATHGRDEGDKPRTSGLTVRAIAVGAVLIVVGVLWTNLAELLFKIGNQAEVVPPPSALVVVVVLGVALALFRFVTRRLGLGTRELVIIFMMCVMALPMASQGLWTWFYGNIVGLPNRAFYGNSTNALAYMETLPDYLIPRSKDAIDAYAQGAEMPPPPEGLASRLLYELKGPVRWDVWLPILGFWGILIATLFAMMLLVNVILRKPWLEGERLRFPLTVIPQAVCDYGETEHRRLLPAVFRNHFFLLGLGATVVFHGIAALHFYYPNFPGWPAALSYNLSTNLFNEHPWDKMGNIWFNVMPLMVGVFYFVDPAVMSSILIFFALARLQGLLGGLTGWSGYTSDDGREAFPFIAQQWYGAMIAYGLAALFFARRHLFHVVKRALGMAAAHPDERKEAVPYPVAFWGLALCCVVLLVWSHYAKLGAFWGAWLFALIFVSLVAAIRIRGESGAPVVHMMAYVPFILYALLGTEAIRVVPALVMSHTFFLMHGQFMMLGATQMEAVKVSDTMGVSRRAMYGALVVAFVFALVLGGFLTLQLNHRKGALNLPYEWAWNCGSYRLAQFDDINTWKNTEPLQGSPGDVRETVATTIGAAVMTVLMVLRRVFPRWPLHPVGYVISNSISASWFMGSVLVAWALKTIIMKLGGIRIYRKLMPMFIGFIVGDAVMFLVFGTSGIVGAARGALETPFKMYVW